MCIQGMWQRGQDINTHSRAGNNIIVSASSSTASGGGRGGGGGARAGKEWTQFVTRLCPQVLINCSAGGACVEVGVFPVGEWVAKELRLVIAAASESEERRTTTDYDRPVGVASDVVG